jgi:uncharacterized protein
MTPIVPGSDGAGRVLQQSGPAAPVTLVLSREVRAGHEGAFEDVLHRLAGEVGRQPGHLDVTVLRPPPGGRRIYTIVSHFASGADADAWLAGEARARAGRRGRLARGGGAAHPVFVRPGGLAGRARRPGAGPARAVEDRAGLSGRDLAVAAWARPLVSVLILIPLMQYAVMPLLTRAARPFLYPARAGQPLKGAL